MAENFLKRITIPELNRADFGEQFREALKNIDFNFQKLANADITKGADGRSCVYFTINLAAPFVYGTSGADSNNFPADVDGFNSWKKLGINSFEQSTVFKERWAAIKNDVEKDYEIYKKLTGRSETAYAQIAAYLLWGHYQTFNAAARHLIPTENSITGIIQKKYGSGTDPITIKTIDGQTCELYGNWMYEFFTKGVNASYDIDIKLPQFFMEHVNMVAPGKISIAMSPDSAAGAYRPVGSLAYWFMDPRFAVTAERDANENVTDVSCIIQWAPDNNVAEGEWSGTFNVVNSFPTIELGNDGRYYWVVNGINTGISPEGIPGKDGEAASFVVVERVENVTGYDPVNYPDGSGITGPLAGTYTFDSNSYSGTSSRYEVLREFRSATNEVLFSNPGVTQDSNQQITVKVPEENAWLVSNTGVLNNNTDPQHLYRIYRIVGREVFWTAKGTPKDNVIDIGHLGDPTCDNYYGVTSSVTTDPDIQALIRSLDGKPAVVIPGPAFSQDRTDTTFWLSTLRAVPTGEGETNLMLVAYCGADGQMTTNIDEHTLAGQMQRLDAYSFKSTGDNRTKPRGLMLPIGSALANSSIPAHIWAAHIIHSDLGGFTGRDGNRGIQKKITNNKVSTIGSGTAQFSEVIGKNILHIGSVTDYRSLSFVPANNQQNAGIPGRQNFTTDQNNPAWNWDASLVEGAELHVDEPLTVTGYRDLIGRRLLLSVEGDTIIGARRHVNIPNAKWYRGAGGLYIGSYMTYSTLTKVGGWESNSPFIAANGVTIDYKYKFSNRLSTKLAPATLLSKDTSGALNGDTIGLTSDDIRTTTTKHRMSLVAEYGIGARFLASAEGFAIVPMDSVNNPNGNPTFSVDMAGNIQTMGSEVRSNSTDTAWYLHTNWSLDEAFVYPLGEVASNPTSTSSAKTLKTTEWYWITAFGLSGTDPRNSSAVGIVDSTDPYTYSPTVGGVANPYVVMNTDNEIDLSKENHTVRLYSKPTAKNDSIVNWLLWRVEPDPQGTGKFALVNKKYPAGSLKPEPIPGGSTYDTFPRSHQKHQYRWKYDVNTRHYSFMVTGDVAGTNSNTKYGLQDAVATAGTNAPKSGVLKLKIKSDVQIVNNNDGVTSSIGSAVYNNEYPVSTSHPKLATNFYPEIWFADSRSGYAVSIADATDTTLEAQSTYLYFAPGDRDKIFSNPSDPANDVLLYSPFNWIPNDKTVNKPGRNLAYGNIKSVDDPTNESDVPRLWRASNRQATTGDRGTFLTKGVTNSPIGWTVYTGFFKNIGSSGNDGDNLVPQTTFHSGEPEAFGSNDLLPTVIHETVDIRHQVGALSVAGISPLAMLLSSTQEKIGLGDGCVNENNGVPSPRGRFGISAAYGVYIGGAAKKPYDGEPYIPNGGHLEWLPNILESDWAKAEVTNARTSAYNRELYKPAANTTKTPIGLWVQDAGAHFGRSIDVASNAFIRGALYANTTHLRGNLYTRGSIRGNGELAVNGNGTFGGNAVVRDWLAIGRSTRMGSYRLTVGDTTNKYGIYNVGNLANDGVMSVGTVETDSGYVAYFAGSKPQPNNTTATGIYNGHRLINLGAAMFCESTNEDTMKAANGYSLYVAVTGNMLDGTTKLTDSNKAKGIYNDHRLINLGAATIGVGDGDKSFTTSHDYSLYVGEPSKRVSGGTTPVHGIYNAHRLINDGAVSIGSTNITHNYSLLVAKTSKKVSGTNDTDNQAKGLYCDDVIIGTQFFRHVNGVKKTSSPALLYEDGLSSPIAPTTDLGGEITTGKTLPLPKAGNTSIVSPMYIDFGPYYGTNRFAPFGYVYINDGNFSISASGSGDYKRALVCSVPGKSVFRSVSSKQLFKVYDKDLAKNIYPTTASISYLNGMGKLDVTIDVNILVRSQDYHYGKTKMGWHNSHKHWNWAYGFATDQAPTDVRGSYFITKDRYVEGNPTYAAIETTDNGSPTEKTRSDIFAIKCNGIDWDKLFGNDIPKPQVDQWFFVGSLYRGSEKHNWGIGDGNDRDRSFQKGLWFKLGTDGKLTIPYWNEAGSLFNCRTKINLSFTWTGPASEGAPEYHWRRTPVKTGDKEKVTGTLENPWGENWTNPNTTGIPTYWVLEYQRTLANGSTTADAWIEYDSASYTQTTYYWYPGWDEENGKPTGTGTGAAGINENTDILSLTAPNGKNYLVRKTTTQTGPNSTTDRYESWSLVYDFTPEDDATTTTTTMSTISNLAFINTEADEMGADKIYDWLMAPARSQLLAKINERVLNEFGEYDIISTIYDNYGSATISHSSRSTTIVTMHIYTVLKGDKQKEDNGDVDTETTGRFRTVTFRAEHNADNLFPSAITNVHNGGRKCKCHEYGGIMTLSEGDDEPVLTLTDEYNVIVDASALNSVTGYLGIPSDKWVTEKDEFTNGRPIVINLPDNTGSKTHEYNVKYQMDGKYYIDVLVIDEDRLTVNAMELDDFAKNFNQITIVAITKAVNEGS